MADQSTDVKIIIRGDNAQLKAALAEANRQLATLGTAAGSANRKIAEESSKASAALRGIGTAAKIALPAVATGVVLVVAQMTAFRRVASEVLELVTGLVGAAAGGFAIAGIRSSIGEAAQFQAALAGVQKVSGLTREQLQGVALDVRDLAKDIPLTAGSLTEIAVAAGQLNLGADQYREFIRLVAQSGAAFDIPAREAGEFFGQLINNFRLTIPQARLVGDSVNTLADSIANVTERDLLSVAARSASAANLFGLTAQQLNALAASLLSTGAPAEIAATAINSVLRQLGAPEAQDPKFAATLEQIGLSAADLKQSLGVDAQGALRDFLARVRELDAQGQRDVLAQLFGGGGDASAIASLVQNLDRYDEAVRSVGDATRYAGSIERVAAQNRALLTSQVELQRNAFVSFKEAIGAPFLAVVTAASRALTGLINAIADFARANPVLTQVLTQVVAIAGALTVLRVGLAVFGPVLARIGALAAGAFAPLLAALGSAASSGAGLLTRLGALRTAIGIGLGGPIGIAVAALITLTSGLAEASQATVTYQGVTGTLSEFVVAGFQTMGEAVSGFVGAGLDKAGEALRAFGALARDTINRAIGFFVGLGRAVPPIATAISSAFRSAFSDVGRIVGAVFADVQAALSGDFSFRNFRAAIASAGDGVSGEFDKLQDTLAAKAREAGQVDYLGAAGKAIKEQATDIARTTGEILRAPLDAAGNALAGRVAANRTGTIPDGPTPGGGASGGRPLPVVETDEQKRERLKRAKEAADEADRIAQASAQAQAAVFAAELARSQAALEASYAARRIEIEQYYADKLALDQAGIDQEIAARAEALTRADAAERIRIEGELEALRIRRVAAAEQSVRDEAAAITAERERLSKENLDRLTAEIDAITRRFEAAQQAAANRVITGDATAGEAQASVRAAAEEAAAALQKLREQLAPLATSDAPEAQRALEGLDESLRGLGEATLTPFQRAIRALRGEISSLEENFPRDLLLGTADDLGGAVRTVISDFKDLNEAAKGFVDGLKDRVLDLISQKIGNQLVESLFGGLLGTQTGGPGLIQTGLQSLFKLFHDGGVVGAPGGQQRAVPALAFAGAPRFHDGGLPGLKRNEVPAILERGEEVLTRRDPRNVLNGGLRGAVERAGAGGTVELKLVIDERAMNTRMGDYIEGLLARAAATQ